MFLFLFIVLTFSVFIFRLVDWQIINREYYKLRANSSNVYFVNTDSVRGEIVDRDGLGLAINDTGYKVVVDRLSIDKQKENETILNAVKLLEELHCSWIDVLPIKLNGETFCFESDKE